MPRDKARAVALGCTEGGPPGPGSVWKSTVPPARPRPGRISESQRGRRRLCPQGPLCCPPGNVCLGRLRSPCGHFPQRQRPGPAPGWLEDPKRWHCTAPGRVSEVEAPPRLGPGLCLLGWLVRLPPGSMLAPVLLPSAPVVRASAHFPLLGLLSSLAINLHWSLRAWARERRVLCGGLSVAVVTILQRT